MTTHNEHERTYYMNDYKGKYFVLSDKEDDMLGSIGTISDSMLSDEYLEYHVDACVYYGIPAYDGDNVQLRSRINKLYEKYE